MKEETSVANLSHSYFTKLQREVEPFLEFFETKKICDSAKCADSPLLERLFFMACLLSKDISIPFKYPKEGSLSLEKMDKKEWLTDLRPFGSKSKQGVVSKSLMFDAFYVVVKKAKTARFDEITFRDFCIGIHLNKILNEAPFFAYTLGGFEYKNQFHIVTEFIDGINLKHFLKRKSSTFGDFLNIFFQILLGLEIAQNKLNFTHYDLHTDNVILVPQNQPFQISLYGKTFTIKHHYKPVMIDFGLSSIHVKGHALGQKHLESKGIFNHLSPGYDIYIFLLFCLDVVQTSNTSIFKGITDLLAFFKLETQTSIELLTNNHIKSLKKGVSNLIPNQFIEYILRHYSDELNVDVDQSDKGGNKCLGCQPIFLKLKKVFDIKDELTIEHKSKTKDYIGYIQTIANNIKIYYWYKDKRTLHSDEIENLILKDEIILQNLLDDLNMQIGDKITIEQKNIFFMGMDYYHLILDLELDKQYPFYNQWLNDFKGTFVFKNIFSKINDILLAERLERYIK